MIVLGIDPGTANTGLALVCSERGVLSAATLKTKPLPDLSDFTALAMRGRQAREQLTELLTEALIRPDVAVVESYMDYGGGHLRHAKRRYYTPNTIAYLDQALEALEIPLIYQAPNEVKRFSGFFEATISKSKVLSNQHRRDAALHALYYIHTRNGGTA